MCLIFLANLSITTVNTRTYDARAKELYGQYAAVNFPGPEKDPLAKWSNAICYGKFTG